MKTPALIAAGLCALPLAGALAQPCSSDHTPRPAALFERFVSADCATCWSEPRTPAPGPSALVVDWIVPTPSGDDAPLSAAATPDALARLQDVGRAAPAGTDVHTAPLIAAPGRLRVAMGPAVNDYVGAVIRFTPPPTARPPLRFWLVLVEQLPAGAEGSPVARHVARNAWHGEWPGGALADLRPMRIPDGARVERLGLAGWVQDAAGRTLAAAQAPCAATPSSTPAR